MKKIECELAVCDGSGIITVQNGDSDFDTEFCPCEIGEALADNERVINSWNVIA